MRGVVVVVIINTIIYIIIVVVITSQFTFLPFVLLSFWLSWTAATLDYTKLESKMSLWKRYSGCVKRKHSSIPLHYRSWVSIEPTDECLDAGVLPCSGFAVH